MSEARTLIAYTDYKSPYAYLAKDPTYELARETGVRLEWRPYVLNIPDFLGSARVMTPRSPGSGCASWISRIPG